MSKVIEVKGIGKGSFGMRLQLRRTFTGIEIAMFGKRGAFLGLIQVDYQDLKQKVASIPEDPYADPHSG